MNANCTSLPEAAHLLQDIMVSELGQMLMPLVTFGHRLPSAKELGADMERQVSRGLAALGLPQSHIAALLSLHPRTFYHHKALDKRHGQPLHQATNGQTSLTADVVLAYLSEQFPQGRTLRQLQDHFSAYAEAEERSLDAILGCLQRNKLIGMTGSQHHTEYFSRHEHLPTLASKLQVYENIADHLGALRTTLTRVIQEAWAPNGEPSTAVVRTFSFQASHAHSTLILNLVASFIEDLQAVAAAMTPLDPTQDPVSIKIYIGEMVEVSTEAGGSPRPIAPESEPMPEAGVPTSQG